MQHCFRCESPSARRPLRSLGPDVFICTLCAAQMPAAELRRVIDAIHLQGVIDAIRWPEHAS